ncbi:hypothetical protein ACFSYH_01925 [Populibacterium corticicola]|uniref:DUF7426 domain-containing protein n=1 Tax=Populibacterium corticicola TaxID=1812826 RepID=A0ABW5XC71_9MICO
MAFKDLKQYLVKDLEIPLGGKTYLVPPPTKENGLILASFIALGINAARGADSSEEDIARVQENTDTNLATISLGGEVHAQMLADGVPEAHIDQAAIYAMYYWTMGEESADAAFETLYAVVADGEVPKALLPLKTGQTTALANLTKTASTPGTGSRPATSDHKPPTSKNAAGSRGVKQSKTGRTSSKTSPSTTASTGAQQPSTGQPSETSS